MRQKIKKFIYLTLMGLTILSQALLKSNNITLNAIDSLPSTWNQDDAIRNSLDEIELSDPAIMNISENANLSGNVVTFGPTIGVFSHYISYEQHNNIRIRGTFSFQDTLANWQRVILKATDINDGGGNGYFFSLDDKSFTLYRQVEKNYVNLFWATYPEELTNENGSIYDGVYRDYVFECYSKDNNDVVINMAINGISCCQVVDSGTQDKDYFGNNIVQDARVNYPNKGYTALAMNSTKDSWYIKGDFTDASFNEDTYLGNQNIYSYESSATIDDGKITLANNQVAFLTEDLSAINAKFSFKATNSKKDEKIFAIGTFTSKKNRANYEDLDGLVANFYKDKVEICNSSKVLASLDGLDLLNKEIDVKIIALSVAKECELAINIDSKWVYGATSSLLNSSGFFGFYSFSNVEIQASSAAKRNYRVLFLGNSITSHSPNESLNYGIGTIGSETWGMATSAPEYDYVHRVVKSIRQISGYENTEYMAVNTAAWEQDIQSAPISNYYADAAAFEADLIVIKLGENTTNNPAYFTYAYYFNNFINYFKTNANANVILATQYWGSSTHLYDKNVDRGVIQVARENNYPLIRLGDLGSTYSSINDASADKDYYYSLTTPCPSGKSWKDEFDGWTSGVKQHPGMVGHENIAARISESVVNYLTGKDAYIDKEEEILEGVYAEYTTSNLYGNVAGAYDYKKCSYINASEIENANDIKLPDNYYFYRGIKINHDGDIYRLSLDLYEDYNANLNYKVFTMGNDNKLEELTSLNDAEYTRDPRLSIIGDIKEKVYIAVEYNPEVIFQDKTLSNEKFAAELKFINRNNEKFIIDVSSLKYSNLTIARNLFPTIISSGKDVEIILSTGKINIEREVFETISSTTNDLYFTIQQLNSTNYLRNATTAINSLNSDSVTFTNINSNSSGYSKDVYEAQIRYNGRSGDALYVNYGISIEINITLDETKLNKLAIISSYLPALGSEIKYTELLDFNNYKYANNVLYVSLKDYDNSLILAYSSSEVKTSIVGTLKNEYFVGEELDISSLIIRNSKIDGTIEDISVNESMVSGYDKNKVGTQKIIITYNDSTFEYQIEVKQKEEKPNDDNKNNKGCKGNYSSSILLLMSLFTLLCLKNNQNKQEEKK